jgi:uncharacterized protein (TIGR03435 family)
MRLGVYTEGSTLRSDAANLRTLVMFAWNLPSFRVVGPAPLLDAGNTRWDVLAKLEGQTKPSVDEFRTMLRTLLEQRFGLRTHMESRETNVYALVVAKGGPKMKLSGEDEERHIRIGPRNGGRNDWFTGTHIEASELISVISIDRPVIERTGLTGKYDVEFFYTPEYAKSREGSEVEDVSIFTAIERLGLKLEPQKTKLDFVIVDAAQMPSAN